MNVDPSVEEIAQIAQDSVATWSRLFAKQDCQPMVAFLSFSTLGSAKHPAILKMRKAYELFKKRCPQVECDGEIQFDVGVSPDVALNKAPNSPVGGRANIFVFPDLNSGNIAYKIAQRLGGFDALGPILQGLHKPYNDLSRVRRSVISYKQPASVFFEERLRSYER